MEKAKLLAYIAPCAMLCCTCMAIREGPVSACARQLRAYSEGICEFLSRHQPAEEREKTHAFFQDFHAALVHLSGGACPGCRNHPSPGSGCIGGCVIPACAQARGVDFCAACDAFPCQKAKDFFDKHDDTLSSVWENGNRRIQAVGLDAYFEEKKDVSHYIHYQVKTD